MLVHFRLFMKVDGSHYRTIWYNEEDGVVQIIDQRALPFKLIVEDLPTVDDVALAISEMHVRGAGLIGATAGFGMFLAALENPETIEEQAVKLKATRPTAVNLAWAVDRQLKAINNAQTPLDKQKVAFQTAQDIANEDAAACKKIGEHGLQLIKDIATKKDGPVNILTHCNAGWLAFVDYGTATSPIYAAHEAGIPVHVWVEETRPRNQGASLTAWELQSHGIPHTIIVDNAGGHVMQKGMVDLVLVGSDRTTVTGDVANKIGTYKTALAAKDNNIPFYVALPSSTFDWNLEDGNQIPIEERNPDEVTAITGLHNNEQIKITLSHPNSPAKNYGFDVTPRRLVSGLITERGICNAEKESILNLFPQSLSSGLPPSTRNV